MNDDKALVTLGRKEKGRESKSRALYPKGEQTPSHLCFKWPFRHDENVGINPDKMYQLFHSNPNHRRESDNQHYKAPSGNRWDIVVMA